MVWLGSCAFILLLLALDLGVLRRKAHIIEFREALLGTLLWVAVSLLFNLFVYLYFGSQSALDFFTGYLVEYSLSVDNLFVFMLIFSYFKVPASYQQRVLFFGIIGAILMRGVFILLGATIIASFHWIIYLFGALLVISGFKLFRQDDADIVPDKNIVVRAFKSITPISSEYDGQKFFTRIQGKLYATPLFIVLISVEVSDLIFAVDSIPAIFGITKDPFIIFTSNIFAVLGLRSLFFMLSNSMNKVALLRYGLALILIFVGLKMLLESVFPISNLLSLAVIIFILAGSVVGSMVLRLRNEKI
jgi:tellurite resistance protein TerC